MPKSLKKAVSVCITSAKGGVGKTITTINLAGIFSSLNKKTLLIDLDLTNGALALYLNKPVTKSIADLSFDLDNHTYTKLDDYVIKYNDYIDCLSCPVDPRNANEINYKNIDSIIDEASFSYDVILIDTTHNLNPLNLYLLDKVNYTLFIMTNDPFDVKNIKSLLSIFHNLDKQNYKVLLNNSRDPFKSYFSLYDLRNIISNNIDYTISEYSYIKNIDKYIMHGQIITLDPKADRILDKDYAAYLMIASDIIGGQNNE